MGKIETKVCTKCGVEKEMTEFYKNGNGRLWGYCKGCARAQGRKWREENPEKAREAVRKWRKENRGKVSGYDRKRWKENLDKAIARYRKLRKENLKKTKTISNKWREKNPEKAREVARKWREKNPEKMRAYNRKMHRKNPLRASVSSLIRRALKGSKNGVSITKILPYTIKELKDHLEKQFIDGMSWDNYGKKGWEYDHIVPTDAFTFNSPQDEQFKQWSSLKNAQPLWAADNIRKSNNIGPEWGNDKLYKEFFGKEC